MLQHPSPLASPTPPYQAAMNQTARTPLHRQRLVLSLAGGVLLSLCDRVHIHHGILSQEDQSFLGQGWWVLPMFCLVAHAAPLGWRLFRQRLEVAALETSGSEFLFSLIAFTLVYCSTGPLDTHGSLLAVGLTVAFGLRLWRRRCKGLLLFSVLLALAGCSGEAALSLAGAFAYDHPDLGPVPLWLPAIYLHGGLLVADLDGYLD